MSLSMSDFVMGVCECGCYLLLNVMDLLSVGVGGLLDRPCMVFQIMCLMPVIPVLI